MVVVNISVDSTTARIESPLPDTAINFIYEACSFKIEGAEHSALFKKGRWNGSKHLYKIRYNSFPAGLIHKVVNLLTALGYESKVEYRVLPPNVAQDSFNSTGVMEARWYQFAAAQAAINARRSIVRVATGGGKTAIANIIIDELHRRTLFLVHTKDLLRQAKDSISSFLGYECGQIGDGVVDPKDITVATIQTISRSLSKEYKKDAYSEEDEDDNTDISNKEQIIRDFINSVGLFIQDEVHRVASDSAFEVSGLIRNASYRVGFSASPWRDDGADLMIEAAFGHRSFSMNASELINMKYLMKPTIIFRHMTGTKPIGRYDQIYKDWVVENEDHNQSVVDDTKIMLDDGRIVLILVKQINHGNILQKRLRDVNIPCQFLSGKDDSALRYNTLEDMRHRRLKCLIATTIADEGIDIKPLDGLILAGRGKSSVRALQRIGRTLRPYDKLDPLIIDYYDRVKFLEDHTCKRIQIYKTEPEFNIIMEQINKR